jgi:hypothetical protein
MEQATDETHYVELMLGLSHYLEGVGIRGCDLPSSFWYTHYIQTFKATHHDINNHFAHKPER